MKFTAKVCVSDVNVEELQRCFVAEHGAMQNSRSSVQIETTNNEMTFIVAANDPTALRATLHGITKLLTVYSKVEK
jgi:tRNA threonylcarbamoyladenosine modification (KEOPS) complex  Pcc1 subunit